MSALSRIRNHSAEEYMASSPSAYKRPPLGQIGDDDSLPNLSLSGLDGTLSPCGGEGEATASEHVAANDISIVETNLSGLGVHSITPTSRKSTAATMDTPRPLMTPDPSNEHVRFIADTSLHRVAKYLRLLGVDCLCFPEFSQDPSILLSRARLDQRILLLASQTLLQSVQQENENPAQNPATGLFYPRFRYFFLKGTGFRERIRHVAKHYSITFAPLKYAPRCPKCNVPLTNDVPDSVKERVDPSVLNYYTEFWHCSDCDELQWGLRERINVALTKVEIKQKLPPVKERKTVKQNRGWVLPTGLTCDHLLRFFPISELLPVMQTSQSLLECCRSNILWRFWFERRSHTLKFSQISEVYKRRTLARPFAHTVSAAEEEKAVGVDGDSPGFWHGAFRETFHPAPPRSQPTEGAPEVSLEQAG